MFKQDLEIIIKADDNNNTYMQILYKEIPVFIHNTNKDLLKVANKMIGDAYSTLNSIMNSKILYK
jgi:hypothetical protein